MRVVELRAKFLAWVRTNRAARTADYYASQLDCLPVKVCHIEARRCRPRHLIGLRLTWHRLQAVQRLFRWAVREAGLLRRNPFRRMVKPRVTGRRRVLSRRQGVRLLRLARRDFRLFLLAARETAARPQELRLVEWSNLVAPSEVASLEEALRAGSCCFVLEEYKARARRADPETPRIIPISARLGRALARGKSPETAVGSVFVRGDGRPWKKNALVNRMRRLRRRAGLAGIARSEGVCCYTLRHTALTRLAADGMATHILQHLAGHAQITTTQRYVHLSREDFLRAWQRFQGKPPVTGERTGGD